MEINKEALEAMTIADLTSLMTLIRLYPSSVENSADIHYICHNELKRRLDNIFISE